MADQERIDFLDFARAYAIGTIVVFHALLPVAGGIWLTAIRFGGAGVHVFMLLSGFSLTVTARRRSLQGFYRRRAGRLLVPYFVFVTGVFLLNQVWPVYPNYGLRAYLGHVLLFKMFDESIISSFGYHLWFISTIIQLYLIFPWLYRLLQRQGATRLLGITALVSALFTAWVIASGRAEQRVFNSNGLVFAWEFGLGMMLADRYLRTGERFWMVPVRWWLPLGAAGIGLQAAFSIIGSPAVELLTNPAALVGYGSCVVGTYQVFQRAGLWRVIDAMVWLANISYEWYLVHGLVLVQLFRSLAPATLATRLATAGLGIVASLIVAAAFRRLLDTLRRPMSGIIARGGVRLVKS